jgi:hypothetical protein
MAMTFNQTPVRLSFKGSFFRSQRVYIHTKIEMRFQSQHFIIIRQGLSELQRNLDICAPFSFNPFLFI